MSFSMLQRCGYGRLRFEKGGAARRYAALHTLMRQRRQQRYAWRAAAARRGVAAGACYA